MLLQRPLSIRACYLVRMRVASRQRVEAARSSYDARARRQGERYMQMGASAQMIGPRRPEASGG